jgi:hypothetical protein
VINSALVQAKRCLSLSVGSMRMLKQSVATVKKNKLIKEKFLIYYNKGLQVECKINRLIVGFQLMAKKTYEWKTGSKEI